jgi:hypothetical protein
MSGLTSALWITGSYLIAGTLFYLLINFLTKGFLTEYLKVKMSRGRLILVKCHDVTDSYYKAGKINTKRNLVVKDRSKAIHTFSKIESNFIARELGMNCIEVNLIKGLVINKDFTGTSGYDLTMLDEIVNRALMLPTIKKEEVWEKAKNLLIIVTAIGVGVCIYLLLNQPEAICKVATVGVTNI